MLPCVPAHAGGSAQHQLEDTTAATRFYRCLCMSTKPAGNISGMWCEVTAGSATLVMMTYNQSPRFDMWSAVTQVITHALSSHLAESAAATQASLVMRVLAAV